MAANYPELALLIASLSLLLSAASFFVGRKDKSAAVVEALKKELADSQKRALDRIEASLQSRISQLEVLGSERHGTNVTTLANLGERMARVDEKLAQIPGHRDIDKLQESISQLASQVSNMKGSLDANTRITDRMNEYLIHKGGA